MNRDDRLATNESLFREVNERIEEGAWEATGQRELDFVCECGDPSCFDKVRLTLEEYEAIRSHPARFAILPGHQLAEVDRVLEEHAHYTVVEKYGEAREVAEEQDPRDPE